jgi:hypothetical protein
MRCLNCPLAAANAPGFGIGSLNSSFVSRTLFNASRPFAIASSGVEPSEMHPKNVWKLDQVAFTFFFRHATDGERISAQHRIVELHFASSNRSIISTNWRT